MGEQKEKRRGGQRDDSEVHISYSRERLMQLIVDTDQKLGAKHDHDFKYHFKKHRSLPHLWRAFKRILREHIDGWQQELPLF